MSEKIKFTLEFQINQALQGLKDLQKNLKGIGSQVKQTQKGLTNTVGKSKIDLQAWGGAFQQLGAVAGNAFSRIIDNSPALGAAFSEVSFATDLLAMSIGEALAPVIQPLIDLIVDMIGIFTALPEPVQAFIGLTIALVAGLSALAVAIIAIQVAGAPLIVIILLIALAVAAIIILFTRWDEIVLAFKENTKLFGAVLVALVIIFGPIVLAIIAIIAIIKNWDEITEAFKLTWQAFTGAIGAAMINTLLFLESAWDTFFEFFSGIGKSIRESFDATVTFISGLIDILVEVWEGFGDSIDGVVSNVTDTIDDLGGVWKDFTESFSDVWEIALDNILGFWDDLTGVLGAGAGFFGDLFDDIKTGIAAGFQGFVILLINGINKFIELINIPLAALKAWDTLPNSIQDSIPVIPKIPIPSFQFGGINVGNGLRFLHDQEGILTPEETRGFQQLTSAAARGGGGISGSPTFNITVETNIQGGIFLDEASATALGDLVGDLVAGKVNRIILDLVETGTSLLSG